MIKKVASECAFHFIQITKLIKMLGCSSISICLKTSRPLLLAYDTVKAEMHSKFPATLLNKYVALKIKLIFKATFLLSNGSMKCLDEAYGILREDI